jgi:hypothetical protein
VSIRKYLIAGVLAAAGMVTTGDRASAQVSVGPAGLRITTPGGNGVVIPYNQTTNSTNSGIVLTTPNGAINTSTGQVYSPAYQSPNGTTTYVNPTTGGYYNPVVGNVNTPPYAYQNRYTYPGTYSNYPGTYSNPRYLSYQPGGYYNNAPVTRGVRVR